MSELLPEQLQEIVALLFVIVVAAVALYRRYARRGQTDLACGGCQGSCSSTTGEDPTAPGSLTGIKIRSSGSA